MKTLLLLRHAKSDWDSDFPDDHERPLAKRGRRAAKDVGRWLAAVAPPDLVLSSTAVRARTTAELAAAAGGWSCPLETTRELYEATPEAVLAVVRRGPDAVSTLLVVGHEPTWSLFVSRAIGGGAVRMKTAAIAALSFEAARWDEVGFGDGVLEWLRVPEAAATG